MSVSFLSSLAVISVSMSLLIVLLLALSPVLPKIVSAKGHYLLWIIVLIGLAIPFRPTIGSGLVALEVPQEAVSYSVPSTISPELQRPPSEPTAEQSQGTVTSTVSVGTVLFSVWAIGAAGVFGWHMLRYFRFLRRIKRWSTPVPDANMQNMFDAAKKQLGLADHKISLVECASIEIPMLIGIFHPVVLLPESSMPDDELSLVLRHELTHYKHKDLYVKLLGIIALSLHWFNPLVYLGCSAVQTVCEGCCDEAVLKDKPSDYRRFYGEVIISMASSKPHIKTALSTCFYAGKFNIKRRLSVIMDTKKKKSGILAGIITATVGITMLSGSIVSFAAPAANANNMIGLERAKAIALADAGLSADGVTFCKAKLDKDGNHYEYDIEFYTATTEYDYEIDAISGTILEKDADIERYNGLDKQMPLYSASTQVGNYIDEAQVMAIALEHAGCKAEEISMLKLVLDYDDGYNIYDIEFCTGTANYDYEVDAASGTILTYNCAVKPHHNSNGRHNAHNNTGTNNNTAANCNNIGESSALSIALNHAGLSRSDVTSLSIEFDYSDGCCVYELEFACGATEYEYEINANTGAILEWDIDYD